MAAARFTAIFDIDSEQNRTHSRSAGIRPLADACEGNLVGRSLARLWPTQPIARIAFAVDYCACAIDSAWPHIGVETHGIHRIKEARVKVALEPAITMADVGPAAMDARIAARGTGGHGAITFADRC